jgi:Phosphotransferase enzyme family
VLWRGAAPAAVVDWPNASAGAPQADVGHCRWNLARTQDPRAADEFLKASGYDYHPYWDVVAALGGQEPSMFTPDDEAFLIHALN